MRVTEPRARDWGLLFPAEPRARAYSGHERGTSTDCKLLRPVVDRIEPHWTGSESKLKQAKTRTKPALKQD